MSYSLLEQVKIRLRQYTVQTTSQGSSIVFTQPEENYVLEELIANAKNDVRNCRHYPTTYSENKINDDIEKNLSNIVIELVIYDYSTEGMEFESNHSENGVNRTFIKRDNILGKIIPFCNILF